MIIAKTRFYAYMPNEHNRSNHSIENWFLPFQHDKNYIYGKFRFRCEIVLIPNDFYYGHPHYIMYINETKLTQDKK